MMDLRISVFGVGAILVTADGRYLMQLRDDHPAVSMRAHWGLFGGVIEAGERPDAALIREIREELDLTIERVGAPFTQLIFDLGFGGQGLHRKIFYEVPIVENDLSRMRLGEGQQMMLFTLDELLIEPRVTPWDLYGVTLHARRASVASALNRLNQR